MSSGSASNASTSTLNLSVIISFLLIFNSPCYIKTKNNAMYEDRLGVVHKHDQIIGVVAFCHATHILASFNKDWEPDWNDNVAKWCIQSTKGEIVVNRVFFTSAFLAC
jgi:hypothetical protein